MRELCVVRRGTAQVRGEVLKLAWAQNSNFTGNFCTTVRTRVTNAVRTVSRALRTQKPKAKAKRTALNNIASVRHSAGAV
jgi:hypothetical protein